MWLSAELLLGLWVMLGGWWLVRLGPAGCLSAGVGLLMIYGSAVLAAWLTGILLDLPGINLWLQVLMTCAAGTLTLALAARWWKPHGKTLRMRLTPTFDRRWRGYAVQTGVLSIWLAGHVVAWVLIANLVVAAHPGSAREARENSLFTGRLLGTPAGTTWERSLSEQQAQLHGLGRGIESLLGATGTRQVMDLMDAIAWISRLDSEARARLIAASPELSRLVHEPALLSVLEDSRLMGLVDEAAQGSLPAVYALGAEPALVALIDSPAMRAAIRAVNPVDLRRQAAQTGSGQAMTWEQAAIATSLDFDAQLASPIGWIQAGGEMLVWDPERRFGVARTRLPGPGTRILHVTTMADCSCWFAGRLLRPERRGQLLEFALPDSAGELVLMFDFAGPTTTRMVALSVREIAAPQGESGQNVL